MTMTMLDDKVDIKGDMEGGNHDESGGVGTISVVCNGERDFSALKKKMKALHFGFETVFMGKSIGFQCFGKFSELDHEKMIGGEC